jgi:hypothetical protein
MLRALLSPFAMPMERMPDKSQKEPSVQLVESFRLLRIRTEQLRGKLKAAIAQFVTIRTAEVSGLPGPQFAPLYVRAAEDALFWTCVCKYEIGEYDSCIDSLDDYFKRFRRNGRWPAAARGLLAAAHLASGRMPEAQAALKMSVGNDDAYRAPHGVLLKRWQELSASSPTGDKPQ